MAVAPLIDDHASPETRALYARLDPSGAESAETRPEIAAFDLGGIEALAGHNLDGVAFPAVINGVREAHAAGELVVLSWHSANPLTHGGPGDNKAPLSVASVLPGGREHEKYVKWLGNAAMLIEQLTDASGTPIPVVFAPFPEHDGDRFWWAIGDGSNNGDASQEEFVALWRFTVEYLRDVAGLHNLVWALVPEVAEGAGGEPAPELRGYPGDEFVDLFGVVVEDDGRETRARLADQRGKPVVSLGSKRE